jgi:hypothetical protein
MRDRNDPPHEPREGQADQPQRHPTIPPTSADEQRGHARPGRLLPGTQPGNVAAGTKKLCEVRATRHPRATNEA